MAHIIFFSLVKVIREGWYANRNNPIIWEELKFVPEGNDS